MARIKKVKTIGNHAANQLWQQFVAEQPETFTFLRESLKLRNKEHNDNEWLSCFNEWASKNFNFQLKPLCYITSVSGNSFLAMPWYMLTPDFKYSYELQFKSEKDLVMYILRQS